MPRSNAAEDASDEAPDEVDETDEGAPSSTDDAPGDGEPDEAEGGDAESGGAESGDEGEAPSDDEPPADEDAPDDAAVEEEVPAEPAGGFREWLGGAPLPGWMHVALGLVLPAIVLVANMWRMRAFTVDDSYISYRFARNFAKGFGLVYNPGERIEGYTNFLWTATLGVGIRLGFDPDRLAKILGGAAELTTLVLVYLIARRLQPARSAPVVATWLLASTIVATGYAVFGLETALFVTLIVAGTYVFLREQDAEWPARFPWSGLVFAFAGLTRPEAPLFLGILMLSLGRGFFGRTNLLRGALFVAPIAMHMLWRKSYYGAWMPNTLTAKTGSVSQQFYGGLAYVKDYFLHAGPAVWVAPFAAFLGRRERRREILAFTAIALLSASYILVVGGDWMPYFRFLAPFEPFCFLLVDVVARSAFERRSLVTKLAIVAFAAYASVTRARDLYAAQRHIMRTEHRFWRTAAGGTADWLLEHERGEIAIGDIGYVGYKTDYPVLDLLGLVDPVISKLPGGYTRKLGRGFVERFFEKEPKYVLLISSTPDCKTPSVPGSQILYRERRFAPLYEIGGKVALDGGFAWCIYQHR